MQVLQNLQGRNIGQSSQGLGKIPSKIVEGKVPERTNRNFGALINWELNSAVVFLMSMDTNSEDSVMTHYRSSQNSRNS